MQVVIDANVFGAFYQETVLEAPCQLTDSCVRVFERLSDDWIALLDEGEKIEYEWKQLVETEWFEAWMAEALEKDMLRVVEAELHSQLRGQLRNLGFPVHTWDIWYARTAKSAAGQNGQSMLISEDMHFFDPREKHSSADRRNRLMLARKGPVLRLLERKHDIYVHCLATCPA